MYTFDKFSTITIRLSSEDKEIIKKVSSDMNFTISKFCRELVLNYAKNYNKKNINY